MVRCEIVLTRCGPSGHTPQQGAAAAGPSALVRNGDLIDFEVLRRLLHPGRPEPQRKALTGQQAPACAGKPHLHPRDLFV